VPKVYENGVVVHVNYVKNRVTVIHRGYENNVTVCTR